jgi:hypothetical protein
MKLQIKKRENQTDFPFFAPKNTVKSKCFTNAILGKSICINCCVQTF